MKQLIAHCGLDCEICEARIATVNNDNALREKVSREWCKMNNTDQITPETINCMGCRTEGIKFHFCSTLCEVRKCAVSKGMRTCAECLDMENCTTLSYILANSDEARTNLSLLRSGRIILRHWREEDAESLFKYASDPDVGPRAGWEPHRSQEESLGIIRNVFDNDTTWAIVLRETGEPVGAIGYGPSCECGLPAREGEPTVGYWVAKPYWNKGICTEALRLMINGIRTHDSISSLISGHFTDNPASGRVMEKCGFVPTGETVTDNTLACGSDKPIRVLRLKL